jgi:2-dehydro-3-deoxygluconokinase
MAYVVPPRLYPKHASIVTLGEAMLRLSTPASARLGLARSLDVQIGGAESNVAVALASLGVPTAWVSALPDNALGRRIVDDLDGVGVDTSAVTLTPSGRVGLYFVEFGSPPRPTTVVYDRDGSAFSRFVSFDPDVLAEARFAVVSGITPALSGHCQTVALEFARAAIAAGAGVVVDVNHRARLWSAEAARLAMAELLRLASVAVVSSSDLPVVFDISSDDIRLALARFAESYAPEAKLVVVTRGPAGALARTAAGEVIECAAFPSVVVDRIGAGDAFLAGLLYGLLAEFSDADAIQFGCALAALKTTVFGDHSRFTADEVLAVINNQRELDR